MSPSTTADIRPADQADREAVERLWESAGLTRAAPDEWAALISGETSAVLIALDGQQVVGSAIASFDGWRAYIYHVAVDPSHREHGLGHELMAAAEQYLLSAGARWVHVMVNEENTGGLALAGEMGYLPEGDVVLAKRLATRVA